MRPTVGQILSGLALGAVTASMLILPVHFLGAEDATVPGLVLRPPAERTVVRAAPIRPRRVSRPAPLKRPVAGITRRAPAPVTVAISHRPSVRPPAAPPKPPPVQKVVAERSPPPEAVAPPPVEPPAIEVASVSSKKGKAKDDKRRQEKERKKWHDDEDDVDEDRGDRDEDRHDEDSEDDHSNDHD